MQKILTEWRKYLVEQQKYISTKQHAQTLRMVRANPGSCINDEGLFSGKNTPDCKRQRKAKEIAAKKSLKPTEKSFKPIEKEAEYDEIKKQNYARFRDSQEALRFLIETLNDYVKQEQLKSCTQYQGRRVCKTLERLKREGSITLKAHFNSFYKVVGIVEDFYDVDIKNVLNPENEQDPTYQAQQVINNYEYNQKAEEYLENMREEIYSQPIWKSDFAKKHPEIMSQLKSARRAAVFMVRDAIKWHSADYD